MNLGDLTAYISARLIDPSGTAVSSEQVEDGVNEAVRYWKKRRFWFNEANDTATLTAQDPSFPYPDDFLVPALKDDGFCIEYSNMRYPLVKISEPAYDALYLGNGYGLPEYYARTGSDEYRCYPIPDQAYTVRRHYLRDYDELTDSDDENDFTEHADRLIALWTLGNLTDELRQDTAMADRYYKKAEDEYRQLNVMNTKVNATGKLTIHSNF
jgi:hypothetical protein